MTGVRAHTLCRQVAAHHVERIYVGLDLGQIERKLGTEEAGDFIAAAGGGVQVADVDGPLLSGVE